MASELDDQDHYLHAAIDLYEQQDYLVDEAREAARDQPDLHMAAVVLDRAAPETEVFIRTFQPVATVADLPGRGVVSLVPRRWLKEVLRELQPQLMEHLQPPIAADGRRLLPILAASKNGAMMMTVGYEAAGEAGEAEE